MIKQVSSFKSGFLCISVIRIHAEACKLFNQEYPDKRLIVRSAASKVVARCTETGRIKDLRRQGLLCVSEETKLNILLEVVVIDVQVILV